MTHDKIAVIDFGGQYAHLIATKIRRLDVLAEIRQPEDPADALSEYRGIIISGGPALISQGESADESRHIFDLAVPILGICYGHQEIAHRYGGRIEHGGREWGHMDLHIVRNHPLLRGLGEVEQVWMSHFDSVTAVGPGFEELGYTVTGDGQPHRYAAIGSDELKRYGFQFHAEVDDTPNGSRMLRNFVMDICGCQPSWTIDRYLEEQQEKLSRELRGRSVFLLASGGVDSTVAAKLFGTALGPDRLHLLHVDNGLMRKDESQAVIRMFRDLGLDQHFHFVDATDRFLEALDGVVEPEEKRTIIGNTFVDVFEKEAKRLGIEDHLLGQGTIYPDTIETGATKRSATIKTHHNRVPLIERLIAEGKVVEPLADLYKVEVRELGERLGIPRQALSRHPFPGPGLGVRLLCSDGRVDSAKIDGIDQQVKTIGGRFGLHAAALPISSVGVKADVRSYEHPVMLTGAADRQTLRRASETILEEVSGVNRCVWNLGREIPARSTPLPGTTTRERLSLLREADHLVMEGLRRHGVYDEIWQCPTVMVPLQINGAGRELVVVRPIHSERAMTAKAAALPPTLVDELKESLLALPGVSGAALDLTSKPPGTIEWE